MIHPLIMLKTIEGRLMVITATTCALASICCAVQPTVINDLQKTGETDYMVTGTDPYFLFGTPAAKSKEALLRIEIQSAETDPIFHTIDLFWSTPDYGFNEEHKITYQIAKDETTTLWRLDLQDLANRRNFVNEQLRSLRIDPNLAVGTKVTFEWISIPSAKLEKVQAPELNYHFTNDPAAINPGIRIKSLNDIGVFDGEFKATGGDPFFVFDLGNGLDLQKTSSLYLDFQLKAHPRNRLYFEIFWETPEHGFSESYKAFFFYTLAPVKKGLNNAVMIRLAERIQNIEPQTKVITGLRLDLHDSIQIPFQMAIEAVDTENNIQPKFQDATVIDLTYTIKPQALNRLSTTQYAIRFSVKDFLKRFFSAPLFALFYIVLICTLFCGLVSIVMSSKSRRS